MNDLARGRHLPAIDYAYLEETMLQLLAIPSPVGLTDAAVRYTAGRFEALGIPEEITRRGAIRATLKGQAAQPARAEGVSRRLLVGLPARAATSARSGRRRARARKQ